MLKQFTFIHENMYIYFFLYFYIKTNVGFNLVCIVWLRCLNCNHKNLIVYEIQMLPKWFTCFDPCIGDYVKSLVKVYKELV